MKLDNSSKQLLSPFDIPPSIPSSSEFDLSHAVSSYRPSTFDVTDLPQNLPVFDNSGRLRRFVNPDRRRVVSMPVTPQARYSLPPILELPKKDLPPPPTTQDDCHINSRFASINEKPSILEKPPTPPIKDTTSKHRAVSMFVLPRIMSRVRDLDSSPESKQSYNSNDSPLTSPGTPTFRIRDTKDLKLPSTPEFSTEFRLKDPYQLRLQNETHFSPISEKPLPKDPTDTAEISSDIPDIDRNTSPQTSVGSADLDEIYRYYANSSASDFHIPKYLVVDDDDSLFDDIISTDASSIASPTKSFSSAATSSLASVHTSSKDLALTQSAMASGILKTVRAYTSPAPSETSSILSKSFEVMEEKDILQHEPEIGSIHDSTSLKDSLFSLDLDIEAAYQRLREPARTVSVPLLPANDNFKSTMSVNTNKELPSVPKSETEPQLQVRKCRNMKSYQMKPSNSTPKPNQARRHSDRYSLSSNINTDRHSMASSHRNASDRNSLQFPSNQSHISVSSRSTRLTDAKSDLQSYVRQRPFSYCLDGGSDYSYSKFGLASSAMSKGPRMRSQSNSDRRSVSFNVPLKNSNTSMGAKNAGGNNSQKSSPELRSISEFQPVQSNSSGSFGTRNLTDNYYQGKQQNDQKTNRTASGPNRLDAFGITIANKNNNNNTNITEMSKDELIKSKIHSFLINPKQRQQSSSKNLPKTPERQNRFGNRDVYV